MNNRTSPENQEKPSSVSPHIPDLKAEHQRQLQLASWALPFLRKDVAHLQALHHSLEVLARPADRPLQTPRMRDHIILSLINIEKALEEAEDLLHNTERVHAGAQAMAGVAS